MKLRRRIGSVFLAFAMALSLIPSVAVSALAATGSGTEAGEYVTLDYGTGTANLKITVNVLYNGEQKDTFTVSNGARSGNNMAIRLNADKQGKFEIENVSIDPRNSVIPTSSATEWSFTAWSDTGNPDITITVTLCDKHVPMEMPEGEITYEEGSGLYNRTYRLYDEQILKILYFNKVFVSKDTEIKGVEPVWVNSFGTPGTGSDQNFTEVNREHDYWNLEVVSDSADLSEVQPGNIRKLIITYNNGGEDQTVEVYAKDLRCIKGSEAGYDHHYVIQLNHNDFHIVYFYNEKDGASSNNYTLYDVKFVDHGNSLGDNMPNDPTYNEVTTRYEFVAWTETYDGGKPFLSTTVVNEDTVVYAQKALSTITSASPWIHVMNNDNLLKERIAELYGVDVNDIDWDRLRIAVYGETDNIHTNPEYGNQGGLHNKWDDEYEHFNILNYSSGAEGTDWENDPIHANDITKIGVYVVKTDGTQLTGPKFIEKGLYDGEFAVSTGKGGSDALIELYINSDEYPDDPNEPDPEPEYTITGIEKELVESADEVTGIDTSTYTFPVNDTVLIPSGESVTLLYAITVTGEEGATFSVTDDNATLVAGTGITAGQGSTFTGTIPTGEDSITFYVSKSFDADDIDSNGYLTNNVTVKGTGDNKEDPNNDDATEETPADEAYPVYTYVLFKGAGDELTEDEKEQITETYGGEFDDGNDYLPIGYFLAPMPNPLDEGDPYNAGIDYKDSLLTDITPYMVNFKWLVGVHKDKFDLNNMGWIKLSIAHGALDFGNELDGDCWHLDGQIQLYAPDISVEKELTQVVRGGVEQTVSDDMTLEVGDQLTWTITVTNSGNADATGLTLTDTLVAEAEDGTPSDRTANVTPVTDGVSADAFNVPAATTTDGPGKVEFTATYTVTADDKGLTLSNTATVSDEDGEVPDDGEDGTENPVAERKVEITKELTQVNDEDYTSGMVNVGDVLTYTITVKNTGNVDLTDVPITDTLWKAGTMLNVDGTPDAAAVADGNKYTIRETIGVKDSVTITYTYKVQDTDAGTTIENTATVSGNDIDDGDGDTVTVEVKDPADYTITVAPVDITIYMGGTGYEGTVGTDGNTITETADAGFPEPGFTVTLPKNLKGVDVTSLTFKEANGGDRTWKFKTYDGQENTTVYKLVPQGEDQEAIRVSFMDGDTLVTSDHFDAGLHVNQTLTISLYKGDEGSEVGEIEVVHNGETYTVDSDTPATLTVRGTTDNEQYAELNETPAADEPGLKADGNVTFTINDSDVAVTDDGKVSLLFDGIIEDATAAGDSRTEMLTDKAESTNLLDALNSGYEYAYDFKYLDLVDQNNGNVWVKASDDVTISWPLPEGTDENTEFTLLHFQDLHRDMDSGDIQSKIASCDVEEIEVTVADGYVTFKTGDTGFSPFALVWQEKDDGGDTPTPPVTDPDDKPTPPPVNPNPPQLNTEDHYAYIVGYEDGTVRPEGDITRAEVATIFFRLLTDESRNEYWSQTNDYIDVAEGDWYNNAVSTLSKAGILNGYEDGSFQPNGNITRAEFATIAARFFEATYEGEDLFPDIKDHWARDYINQAAHAGIVNGYEDGTFKPQENITRAEAMTIVNRTLDRHPDADHFLADMITWPDNPETAWYYEQVQEATNSHEYIMKTDADKNSYEIWKKILPVRDWSDLENTWSEAHAG